MTINENEKLKECKHWIEFIMFCDKQDDQLSKFSKRLYIEHVIKLLGEYISELIQQGKKINLTKRKKCAIILAYQKIEKGGGLC